MMFFKGENNNVLNQGLDKRGFCTTPLLNNRDIEKLLTAYMESTPKNMTGFHPTMFYEDADYRKKLNDVIIEVLNDKLKNIISDDYKILYGNFMVKEPGKESVMKIHQDWTYVDETKHKSFAFWIPLCDLTTDNGAFYVVPYSHRAENIKRGPGTHCPFFEHKALIEEKFSKPLYLKAGEAVCWNHKLAHYSPANFSDNPRIAVTVIIVPKNVEVVHYFKAENDNNLECFKIEESFFFKYTIGKKPFYNCGEKYNQKYTPVVYLESEIINFLDEKKSF